MNLMRTVARPLLAAPFIVDGLSAVSHPHSHVQRIQDLGEVCAPVMNTLGIELDQKQLTAASRAMGAVSVVAGAGLALGIAPRPCAAVLCALSVPVAVVNAAPALKHGERGDFARRIAMIGALAIASTDRVGAPSTAWRFNTWRNERRAQLEAAAKASQANA